MPFPTRESSFDRGRKSQLPPSPGPPDWVAVGNDFSPMPTPTKHSPPSHSRKGSIASKIYRALSLNRRDAGPSPRVTVSDISSPIPTPSTPVQWPGARPIDRTPTPLDPSAAAELGGRSRHRSAASQPPFLGGLWPPGMSDPETRRHGMLIPDAEYERSMTPSSTMLSLQPLAETPPSSPLGRAGSSPSYGRTRSMSAAHDLRTQPLTSMNRLGEDLPSIPSKFRRGSLPPLPLTPPTAAPQRPASPTGTSSLRSATSSQFRIRRKPPPRMIDEEFFSTAQRPASAQEHHSSMRDEAEDVLGEKTPTSAATRHLSMDMRRIDAEGSPSRLQQELDVLFDELFNECRAGMASPVSSPSGGHRRSRSDFPESYSSSLRRTAAIRKPSTRRILLDSQADNVSQEPADSAPRFKNPTPKNNPFFTSGRNYELPRGGRNRTSLKPITAGRVRNAVLEIERKNSTPSRQMSTPIRDLGSILERSSRVDSDELTLESKRMMEAARRRRSIR